MVITEVIGVEVFIFNLYPLSHKSNHKSRGGNFKLEPSFFPTIIVFQSLSLFIAKFRFQ